MEELGRPRPGWNGKITGSNPGYPTVLAEASAKASYFGE
jgi:hypothetical protein